MLPSIFWLFLLQQCFPQLGSFLSLQSLCLLPVHLTRKEQNTLISSSAAHTSNNNTIYYNKFCLAMIIKQLFVYIWRYQWNIKIIKFYWFLYLIPLQLCRLHLAPPAVPHFDYHCIIMLWDQGELCVLRCFQVTPTLYLHPIPSFFMLPGGGTTVSQYSMVKLINTSPDILIPPPPPGDKVLLPQLQPIERVSDLSAPYFSESALQPSNTLIDMWTELGLVERMTHPPRSWTNVPLATVSISAFIVCFWRDIVNINLTILLF